MIANKIFWSSVAYKYREDHESYPELKGGFVAFLLRAKDARQVLTVMENEFSSMGMDLVEVEFIRPYELDIEWEDEEVGSLYLTIYKRARKTDTIQFHIFHEYRDEEE
jgi:hypothetical protein